MLESSVNGLIEMMDKMLSGFEASVSKIESKSERQMMMKRIEEMKTCVAERNIERLGQLSKEIAEEMESLKSRMNG